MLIKNAICILVIGVILASACEQTLAHCHGNNSHHSLLPSIVVTKDLNSTEFDAIIVIAQDISSVPLDVLKNPLTSYLSLDESAEKGVFMVSLYDLPAKKIIFSGTGKLENDWDDVRNFADAAKAGIKKALGTGSKAPLLVFNVTKFPEAEIVTILGALEALYVPLEIREQVPEKAVKVSKLGIFGDDSKIEMANALEEGRIIARDIGGSDPERMAAPRVEEYIHKHFDESCVKIEVIKGQSMFEDMYPCLAAVNRAASGVPRHDGRVIWLTYEPEGPIEKSIMLVGKGITYDSGGTDIKTGGSMAGMSRDKVGAADVAGFMKVVSILKPTNVKVIAAMGMVRNSAGKDAYVADEIITSRAGVRIRVGNTDAEGRMVMLDLLAHMKEKALTEINPHLFTIATLTGAAVRAYGPYTGIMDNGPAKKENFASKLQETGELYGDMFEISNIRKDEFEYIKDKTGDYGEILQIGKGNSKNRGQIYPAAFLQKGSGLTDHQVSSEKPLKYTHLDVAGSRGLYPDPPTASTVVALSMHLL